MVRRSSRGQESRRRVRELRREEGQRRQDAAVDADRAAASTGLPGPVTAAPAGSGSDVEVGLAGEVLASGRRVAGQEVACGWCGQPILLRPTGRMPKWCSAACRHRAWEQNRAAASGRAAVDVVDRYVAAVPADGPGWIAQLSVLADQVTSERGRITSGDLEGLAGALELVQAAVADRAGPRGASHRD